MQGGNDEFQVHLNVVVWKFRYSDGSFIHTASLLITVHLPTSHILDYVYCTTYVYCGLWMCTVLHLWITTSHYTFERHSSTFYYSEGIGGPGESVVQGGKDSAPS